MARPIALKQKKWAGVNAPNVAKNKKLGESSPPRPSLIRPSIINDKMSEGQRCLLTQAPITLGEQSREFPQPYRTATRLCLPMRPDFELTIPARNNIETKALTEHPPPIFLFLFGATFCILFYLFFRCHFFCFFSTRTGRTGRYNSNTEHKTIDKTGTQTNRNDD